MRECYACGTTNSINQTTGYTNWIHNWDDERNVLCRTCHKKYDFNYRTTARKYRCNPVNKDRKNSNSRKKYKTDYKRILELNKQRRLRNLKKCLAQQRAAVKRRRIRVLTMVGRGEMKCVNCGCDRFEFLEINHKNKDGSKEKSSRPYSLFIGDILAGRRGIEDLEILCKPCNSIHLFEFLYGKQPYTISWREHSQRERGELVCHE